MKDPRRLLEGDGTDIERNLLEAGQSEHPNLFSKRRAAIAIGAIGAASVWPTAAGATAKISKAGLPLLVKVFAIGAVSVGTLGTAGYFVTRPASKPATEAPAAPAQANPAPASHASKPAEAPPAANPGEAVPVESLEVEHRAEPARPAPVAQRAGGAPKSSASESTSIRDETRVIDEAQRAIEAGDIPKAKRTLDEYKRHHPRGTFEEEAVALRIEALSRSGKKDAAKALARSFRASYPNSPHLRRIDSVLAEP